MRILILTLCMGAKAWAENALLVGDDRRAGTGTVEVMEGGRLLDEKGNKIESLRIGLVAIPAGRLNVGEPKNEKAGVEIKAFWMSECEITADLYFRMLFENRVAKQKAELLSKGQAAGLRGGKWGVGW